MPIFDFECENCGTKFEVEFFNRKDVIDYTRCNKCGKFAKRILPLDTIPYNGK